MSRVRDERGFTLIEVLVAATLMLVVLGATLTLFDSLQDNQARTQRVNEAQDEVRTTVDRMARELRNLASPSVLTDSTTIQPKAVERAGPHDLVFLTVAETKPSVAGNLNDANVQRVRYCLEPGTSARLYMQWQTWTSSATPPAVPADTSCPTDGGGWNGQRVIAEHLVNHVGNRPFFMYDSTELDRITRIRTRAIVDPTTTQAPPESELITSVVLRNQNRVPVAAFSVANGAQPGTIILNGSASSDPENQTLRYEWQVDGVVRAECTANSVTCTTTALTPGLHTVTLTVSDQADLEGAASQQWCVPGTGVTCSEGEGEGDGEGEED